MVDICSIALTYMHTLLTLTLTLMLNNVAVYQNETIRFSINDAFFVMRLATSVSEARRGYCAPFMPSLLTSTSAIPIPYQALLLKLHELSRGDLTCVLVYAPLLFPPPQTRCTVFPRQNQKRLFFYNGRGQKGVHPSPFRPERGTAA